MPPPPPVTPSPHRFIVKKEPSSQRRTPLAQTDIPGPSTQQFNPAPRFTFSSTPRPVETQPISGPTPSAARFATGLKPHDADDSIQSSWDEPTEELQDSIEVGDEAEDLTYGSAEERNGSDVEEPTPKRRRVTSPLLLDEDYDDREEQVLPANTPPAPSAQETDLSSSIPILSSPPTPKHTAPPAGPRFLLSAPLSPSRPPFDPAAPTFLKPPRFRPPDPSEAAEQPPPDPLPEQFSPHRRGQKYLPGGLAAEVRDWLINIESAIPSHQDVSDPWVAKILVDEVSGGSQAGMTLVRGRRVLDQGRVDGTGILRCMLAGEGQATGLQKARKVEAGDMIGVKAPVWEVELEGVKWGVGVDWKVI